MFRRTGEVRAGIGPIRGICEQVDTVNDRYYNRYIDMTVEGKPASSETQVSGRSDRMPKQFAPLLRNEWYVIAASDDVHRKLGAITVLGEPLVYYRSEGGDPVVLEDRCAHRLFPLSKSHLEGDSIRCAYHGFVYDGEGKCIAAPGRSDLNFGVRHYPAVERGPWLWVWMGDAEAADEALIPLLDPPGEGWHSIGGYVLNECNYMLVLENLLDLSHLHFLHANFSVADESYGVAMPESLEVPRGVGTRKVVERTAAAAVAARCGGDPERLVRRTDENRATASLSDQTIELEAVDHPEIPLTPTRQRVMHALTPLDLYRTHQFWRLANDAPIVNPEQTTELIEKKIFAEDQEAVACQMQAIMADRRGDTVARLTQFDRYATRLHRMLVRRGEAEQA